MLLISSLKTPCSHAWHSLSKTSLSVLRSSSVRCAYPVLHWQSRGSAASSRLDGTVCELTSHCTARPPVQKCLCLQTLHITEFSALYLPSSHFVHRVCPSVETCVLLHDSHTEMDVAAITVENVSTPHKVQTILPYHR